MLAFLLTTALVGTNPSVPVSVSLNQNGRYLPGSGVQVTVRPGADGYLLVLNADPDGRVRVLFPLDPTDDAFVRGGRTYQLEDRGGRNTAFVVDWSSGSGTIFAALSKDPLQPGNFALNGHWDYRTLTLASDDDEVALRTLAEQISPSGVQYDFSKYFIGAGTDAGFDGGGTVVVGVGGGWGMGWGMGWGWGGWGWGWGGGAGRLGVGLGSGLGLGTRLGVGWRLGTRMGLGRQLLLGRWRLGKYRRRNHAVSLAHPDADVGWPGSPRCVAARRGGRAGYALGGGVAEWRLSQSQRRARGAGNADKPNIVDAPAAGRGVTALRCGTSGRRGAARRKRPGSECQSGDAGAERPRREFTAGQHGPTPDERAGLPCAAARSRCGRSIR